MFDTPDIKMVLKKDHNNLKAGLAVEFKGNFTVVVGANGAGKTSLLSLLKSNWKGFWMGRVSGNIKDYVDVTGLDGYGKCYDYTTASDNVQGKGFSDMDHLLSNKGLGISLMRASSGQAQMGQLNVLINSIIKDEDLVPEKPALLVLDEPEISLSLGARMTWGITLRHLALKYPIKIITASHDESIIRSATQVYDITTGLTTDSGEAYIDGMREAFRKKYAAFI